MYASKGHGARRTPLTLIATLIILTLPLHLLISWHKSISCGITPREIRAQVNLMYQSVPETTADLTEKINSIVQMARDTGTVPNWPREKLKVMTGFNDPGKLAEDPETAQKYDYKKRRQALRDTWFPSSAESIDKFRRMGIVVKFIVGHSKDLSQEDQMNAEEKEHNDFIRVPLIESYHGLPNKTKNFFASAMSLYDADWIVKVDDDVYFMVERILGGIKQWEKMGADYIGCMKNGYVWREEGSRWFEPQHLLLGNEYYIHAYGSIYVLSKKTVEDVILRNFNNLRVLANEDTTLGVWMLGHNVTHFEDMRLCSPKCSLATIGVLRNECAGLCNPLKDMYMVHHAKACQGVAPDPLPYLPSYPDHTAFEAMRV